MSDVDFEEVENHILDPESEALPHYSCSVEVKRVFVYKTFSHFFLFLLLLSISEHQKKKDNKM